MILNVLRLRLRDGLTERGRDEVLSTLRRIGALDSVSVSVVGDDFDDPSGQTIGFAVGFADIPAFRTYLHDPIHLAAEDVVLPRLSHASALRCGDEAVGAKVQAALADKAAAYPDWAARAAAIFGVGSQAQD